MIEAAHYDIARVENRWNAPCADGGTSFLAVNTASASRSYDTPGLLWPSVGYDNADHPAIAFTSRGINNGKMPSGAEYGEGAYDFLFVATNFTCTVNDTGEFEDIEPVGGLYRTRARWPRMSIMSGPSPVAVIGYRSFTAAGVDGYDGEVGLAANPIPAGFDPTEQVAWTAEFLSDDSDLDWEIDVDADSSAGVVRAVWSKPSSFDQDPLLGFGQCVDGRCFDGIQLLTTSVHFGSCCIGPADCEDSANPSGECDRALPATCMNTTLCDKLQGEFAELVRCDAPTRPCPACDIAVGPNCQMPDLPVTHAVMMSDLSAPPNGVVVADDFVPTTADDISTVCVWGAYLDIGGQDTGPDCSASVTDDFRVRIYTDAAGIPGGLVAESTVGSIVKEPVTSGFETSFIYAQMYEFHLRLDTPIGGLDSTGNTVYWLEVTNNTTDSDRCNWHWAQTSTGANNFSVIGTSAGYDAGSARAGPAADMAFCIDQALLFVDPPTGACCVCTGGCTGDVTLMECHDVIGGVWSLGVSCAEVVCGGFTDLCPGDAVPISGNDLTIAFDTTCATTDGPPDYEMLNMGSDVWYKYTATCTGRMTVSMCASGNSGNAYDSVLAVYRDVIDPTSAPCPSDLGAALVGTIDSMDEGCNGIADGGAGIVKSPLVVPGDRFMIRVGGYNEEAGRGILSIGCVEEIACFVSNPPIPEGLETGGTVAGVGPINTKNRYISVTTGNPGRTQAVRVRFVSLPAPFDVWNGMDFFVGPPREVCENSGKGLETAPEDCPAALPTRTFWAAPLVCTIDEAHYMDWHGWCDGGTCVGGLRPGASCIVDDDCVEYIHLYNEGLVPSLFSDNPATYDIPIVDETCDDQDPASYSAPLTMIQSRWGDVCGPGPGGACTSVSDGVVDVTNDVLGVLGKFANLNDLQKARVDLEPGDFDINNGPDFKVNVVNDVLFTLSAFGGAQYPFVPGNPCGSGLSPANRRHP